ncbi:MAG: transcriptional regulator [Aestuariibacter sp.]|nr:transcriptional regulator [Aestuariibacter sp.]
MIFIETSLFTKLLHKHLSDDEYQALQLYLLERPEVGDIIVGSSGVRKMRWAIGNKGKSGGIRVIYYWRNSADEIWMLTLYPKNERDSIEGHVLKQIAEEIENV